MGYRKDATLREVLTTLRNTAPATTEYRHPLARYTFRAVYADAANRGRYAQKDLGTVYSRDILGEPGALDAPAPRLLQDEEGTVDPSGDTTMDQADEKVRDERTLDELRFVPGDYMCVMVMLPKNATTPVVPPGEISIKGSGIGGGTSNGWKSSTTVSGGRDGGWGGSLGAAPPLAGGRGGGGHWRGESSAPRGGRGGGRGLDRDRRVPPPRRDSPPPRRGGWGDRRRSVSRSRSRSPPRRKNSRYD